MPKVYGDVYQYGATVADDVYGDVYLFGEPGEPPDPLLAPAIRIIARDATSYEVGADEGATGGVEPYIYQWQEWTGALWQDIADEDGLTYEAAGLTAPYDEQVRLRVSDDSDQFATAIDQTEFVPDALNATEITVDDASGLSVGDLIRPGESGEIMRINGIADNTLTVTRGWWNTTKTELADDMAITRLEIAISNELQVQFPFGRMLRMRGRTRTMNRHF